MEQSLNHPDLIRHALIESMKIGQYAHCRQLPPEKELSEKLNVSRTLLRDVLGTLEQEGLIIRRHGVGTIINRRVLALSCRIDIETEFLDMIRQSGFQPSVHLIRVSTTPASDQTAQQLQTQPGIPLLYVERVCSADGQPAIYCTDVIPVSLIKKHYTMDDLRAPIFSFLRHFCGVVPYMDVTSVRPVLADSTVSEMLRIPPGSPVLNLEELDLDQNGAPVFLSSQYFADGILQHTIIRKKL